MIHRLLLPPNRTVQCGKTRVIINDLCWGSIKRNWFCTMYVHVIDAGPPTYFWLSHRYVVMHSEHASSKAPTSILNYRSLLMSLACQIAFTIIHSYRCSMRYFPIVQMWIVFFSISVYSCLAFLNDSVESSACVFFFGFFYQVCAKWKRQIAFETRGNS